MADILFQLVHSLCGQLIKNEKRHFNPSLVIWVLQACEASAQGNRPRCGNTFIFCSQVFLQPPKRCAPITAFVCMHDRPTPALTVLLGGTALALTRGGVSLDQFTWHFGAIGSLQVRLHPSSCSCALTTLFIRPNFVHQELCHFLPAPPQSTPFQMKSVASQLLGL